MEQKVTKVWAIKKSGQGAGELLELESGTSLANIQFQNSNEAQQVFQVQGFEVERVYGLEDECSLDDHRSCDLRSAAGMAVDWLQVEGKPLPETLERIQSGGQFTESELKAALVETHKAMPDQYKVDVEALQDALWKSGQNG